MSKYSENMPPDLKAAIGWMYSHVKSGSVFLDFGCSSGYFGALIKQAKNARVYGVEISEDAKEAQKVLDGVYSFDLDGPWPKAIYERKYDYAFFGDVLEHLKYPDKALENTKKLLKPCGRVFVSIPNIAHMSVRLELLAGNFEYEPTRLLDNTHLKYFTLKSFTALAQSAGYKVTPVDYSLVDYPKEVIEKWLKHAGLVPTVKFWRLADKIEARVFQYKFILEPLTAKARPAKELKKPPKPEQEREAYTDDLKNQVEVLQKHAKEQAKIIEHYMREGKDLAASNVHLIKELAETREFVNKLESYKAVQLLKKILARKK